MSFDFENNRTTTEQIKRRYRCKGGWIEERWVVEEGETKQAYYVDYFVPDGGQQI